MSERKITLKTPDSKRPLEQNETVISFIPKLPGKVEPWWVDEETLENIEIKLHRESINNHDKIIEQDDASCFYCLNTFKTETIHRWTDDGQTAICPKCDIDSVLPGLHSNEILVYMHHNWFCSGVNMETGEEVDVCDCY